MNVTEFSVEKTELFTRWLKSETYRLDVEKMSELASKMKFL